MDTEELIKQLGKKLEELKLTIVTTESCTGGYLAYQFSSNREASFALERGYVTYSNQSKEELLNIKAETLQLQGAVSKEVALEMATGALKNSKAQISIATTGIAGTDIGENKKGTVWIAFASILLGPQVLKKEFGGTRKQFIKKSTFFALSELLIYLGNFSI